MAMCRIALCVCLSASLRERDVEAGEKHLDNGEY